MDTFLFEMSMKWMFTFKNFRNVYWHGKTHSAMTSFFSISICVFILEMKLELWSNWLVSTKCPHLSFIWSFLQTLSYLEFNNVQLTLFYFSILKCRFSRRELFTRCEWLNIWRSLQSIGATVFPWDFARQYISVSPRNLTLLVMARRRRSSNAV